MGQPLGCFAVNVHRYTSTIANKVMAVAKSGFKALFVHGAHRQHGFFHEITEKLRPFREIRVQRALKPDFAQAMQTRLNVLA